MAERSSITPIDIEHGPPSLEDQLKTTRNHLRLVVEGLHDLKQEVEKSREECVKDDQETAQLTISFMTKAFAIFCAWNVKNYFVSLIGGLIFGGTFGALDAYQKVYVNLIWIAIAYILCPWMMWGCSGFVFKGSASRTLCQDALQLWYTCCNMLIAWSFKDLVAAFTHLVTWTWAKVDIKPDYLPLYSDGYQVEQRFKWFGITVALAVMYTVLVAFINLVMHLYHTRNDGKPLGSYTLGHFSGKWLKGHPLALGVGLAWYEVTQMAGLGLPMEIIKDFNYINAYVTIIRFFAAFLTTKFVIWIMRWGKFWDKRKPALKDASALEFLWEFLVTSFLKAQPFVFAWAWANFFYVCFYRVCFDCKAALGGPYKCGPGTIFMNIYYAIGITVLAILVVPAMKDSAGQLKKVGAFYTDSLLTGDKARIKFKVISDDLLISFFGIAIGWAWTGIMSTECRSNITPSCPATMRDFGNIIAYLVTVICFLAITVYAYHSFIEGYRLAERANKVIAIEEGNAKGLFKGADADASGTIDQAELEAFLDSSGIDKEIFVQAFKALDLADGTADGHCNIDDLMEEFGRVVHNLKDPIAGGPAAEAPVVPVMGAAVEMKTQDNPVSSSPSPRRSPRAQKGVALV